LNRFRNDSTPLFSAAVTGFAARDKKAGRFVILRFALGLGPKRPGCGAIIQALSIAIGVAMVAIPTKRGD
jgi:hypothetical protein